MTEENKDLKINIKNSQIAEAIQLDKLKKKLAKKKADGQDEHEEKKSVTKAVPKEKKKEPEEEAPRRKARSKSAFAKEEEVEAAEPVKKEKPAPVKTPVKSEVKAEAPIEKKVVKEEKPKAAPIKKKQMLGPTGRHINDLLPKPRPKPEKKQEPKAASTSPKDAGPASDNRKKDDSFGKKGKPSKFKEFKDVKPSRPQTSRFDARDRHGLRSSDDGQRWRKKRPVKQNKPTEDLTIRPDSLTVRLPITIKDLAAQMKLKASQLIAKLFMQGVVVTINDFLEDETTIQLLGEEFKCTISIDTSEEERIKVTGKSIKEEILESNPNELITRAPVVAFMGHVDHGKTSLIDYIRKSSITSGESGAITQHIGAFKCHTEVGDIAILDTPGHEAFSSMRARGADVTDIVVLVVAGDEGIRAQTEEALNHAKAAGVTIVVAINKCDKPNFDTDTVYRQLSEKELLPEAWGGQTITVNTSAKTGEGIQELLEMLALQAEVLELKANPKMRARGSVLESELHKGMGSVATILVQNGTLKMGDPLVFGQHWGRVKTMKDENGKLLDSAGPSTPIEITGLSGLPDAGEEFIVVSSEQEAKEIAEVRMFDQKKAQQLPKKVSIDSLLQQASDQQKKVLKIILRADVQGSLEALKAALLKIKSEKVEADIISSAVGEVSESDVLLAAASKAVIVGFHTRVESNADQLLKQHGVNVLLHDIIYHAIDDVKAMMTGMLDKVAQESDTGKAEVKAVFKSSQLGNIAGCLVTDGKIHRNNSIRVMRDGSEMWKGPISSIRRVKEDVREVLKGTECGITLSSFDDFQEGDILEAFEITYLTQEL